MSPQSTTAADQLPGALLARILQYVPLQQRLASCALVCKAWVAAAAAATHKLSLTVRHPDADSAATEGSAVATEGSVAATEGSAADPSSSSIIAKQPDESCLELSGFTGWLKQHGSNLNRLELQCIIPGQGTTDVKAQLQLPCPALVQLTSLSLGSCVVSTAPHGLQQAAAAASTQALPQLVDLDLEYCKYASLAGFQQLASATGLTALELKRMRWDDSPQPRAAAGTGLQASALAAVLQACSSLRRLGLCYWERDSVFMPLSSLAVISGLQQLQDLAVDMRAVADLAPLLHLPTQLTRLDLRVPSDSLDMISGLQQLQDLSMFLPVVGGAPDSLPLPDLPAGLTRLMLTPRDPSWRSSATCSLLQQGLSQLCVLKLCNVGVDVFALSSMSKLQQLAIDRCELLPEAASVSSRVSALLAVVGELKLLHELKLVVDFRDDGDEQDVEVEAVPSAAFAALTASSQLRVLHVELSHDTEVALPGPDVLRHMFPAGRRLGQLHTLVLGSVQYCTSQWRVPLAALARIAASCPAVQTLSLVDVFEEGRQRRLLPLLDLTMLSSLRVGGAAWNDSAAGVVAQLTQLTSLEWVLTQGWYSNALGDPIKDYQLTRTGLAQLVSLERLQYCSIDQAEALTQTPLLDFELKFLPEFTSSDQDGPVWIQIHRLMGVSELVLKLMLQRQQRHEADMQELQRLRCRVAEPEDRACGS